MAWIEKRSNGYRVKYRDVRCRKTLEPDPLITSSAAGTSPPGGLIPSHADPVLGPLTSGQPILRCTSFIADGPGEVSAIHGPSTDASMTPSSNQA